MLITTTYRNEFRTASESCEQTWADLSPADQQERTNGVESRLAEVAGNNRFGHVECQGDQAGEDQQPTGRSELL